MEDSNATDLGSVLNDQQADNGAAASHSVEQVDQGAHQAEPPAATHQEPDHVPRAALQDERRKRQDMERELAHYRQLELQRQQQQAQRQAPQQETPATKAIRPEQFNTYEEYLEAVAEAKAEERATKVFEERMRQHGEQQRQAQIQQATASDLSEVVNAGRAKYQDFDEVVSNPSLMISDQMMNAMLVVDGGHEVGYHLGKNPAEAFRIYQLPPSSQAREIGKLAKQLANPESSTAPAVTLPRTLTQTRSANGQYAANAYTGPTPLNDILKSKGK